MKTICLINGSPRGEKSSSLVFLKDINRRLPDTEYDKRIIALQSGKNGSRREDHYDAMIRADSIVFFFPLYAYGLPGALMRFIEDFRPYADTGNGCGENTKVYAIINCGFPRPEICGEAVRVIKNFCLRFNLRFRSAVCIGTGLVVAATKKIPFLDVKLKRALACMVKDIAGKEEGIEEICLIRPVIPEPILIFIKNQYEKKGEMILKNDDKRPVIS